MERISEHDYCCSAKRGLKFSDEVDLHTFTMSIPSAWANSHLMDKYGCVESLAYANKVLVGRLDSVYGGSAVDELEAVCTDQLCMLIVTFLLAHCVKGHDLVMKIFPTATECLKTGDTAYLPQGMYRLAILRDDKAPCAVKIDIDYDASVFEFRGGFRVPTVQSWSSLLFSD